MKLRSATPKRALNGNEKASAAASAHDALLAPFDADRLRRFRRSLIAWYARHARDLPWRRSADPYVIWISEIMLQQTTVTAVVPYFERFLGRFPDVISLAAADEQEVLRYWEGLGYYSRARNIHKTAHRIATEQGGRFPSETDALMSLPGIGRYTAGAIASFAFDHRAPIVEANTLRLYSRLLGLRDDPRSQAAQQQLWKFAEHVLPRQLPGRFNQALMELGSQVCTPIDPRCAECPVRSCCAAHADGTQDEIPVRVRRPDPTKTIEIAVAIERDGRYLLCRRPHGERWAGLWDFPRFAWGEEQADKAPISKFRRWAESQLESRLGIRIMGTELLKEMRHTVTRYRIRLLCFTAEYVAGSISSESSEHDWVEPRDFVKHPLCVTGRKLAQLLIELDSKNVKAR